jgi:diamine N-acetyltransferase
MIELRNITFENINQVINIKSKFSQRKFVEKATHTIAMAYAGISEGYPGFLSAIYSDGVAVGLILIGKAPVDEHEPEILRKYEYVYRILGFLIDKNHQNQGIGRRSLKLALEKIKEQQREKPLPIALECHAKNKNALSLYEFFRFNNIGRTGDNNYILALLP